MPQCPITGCDYPAGSTCTMAGCPGRPFKSRGPFPHIAGPGELYLCRHSEPRTLIDRFNDLRSELDRIGWEIAA